MTPFAQYLKPIEEIILPSLLQFISGLTSLPSCLRVDTVLLLSGFNKKVLGNSTIQICSDYFRCTLIRSLVFTTCKIPPSSFLIKCAWWYLRLQHQLLKSLAVVAWHYFSLHPKNPPITNKQDQSPVLQLETIYLGVWMLFSPTDYGLICCLQKTE